MRNDRQLGQAAVGQQPRERALNIHTPIDLVVAKREIENALQHVEQIDAQRVSVALNGNRIVLRGDVKTWREHEAAGKAASMIAGVKYVQNEIRVVPWMF